MRRQKSKASLPDYDLASGRRPRHALRNKRAVRLMKDHLIDAHPLAAKFDDEALQFDDAKPSPLLRRGDGAAAGEVDLVSAQIVVNHLAEAKGEIGDDMGAGHDLAYG